MKTARTVAALRAAVAGARADGRTIGLVPTMGAFHEGHLSLMRRARAGCDMVVVSLFVNPTQFGRGEDYGRYPRDERRDAEMAAAAGVDLLFVPGPQEVFPDGFATTVTVGGIGDVLCGAPGSRGRAHFDGVATVVAKLLNMCTPDIAYFGRKDHQQTLVIERLVRDLDIPVQVQVCPTVRDADGLALSSRNAYLTPAEGAQATALGRALEAARRAIRGGECHAEAVGAAQAELASAGVEPEYLEILRADDLSAPHWEAGEPLVVALAATVGRARLIDNVLVEVPAPAPAQTTGQTPAVVAAGS
jgi:pantoate--beta-alanine ligase